tara:strand:+ start:1079 stop:1942 length:864 start_codon:yes stop_codon:yes gene_type:complete
MNIGLIGFGQMGSGAAYNLNKKYKVLIYDKDKEKIKNAKSFSTVEEIFKKCQVSISFLPNDKILMDAHMNKTNGILNYLKKNDIHISCSTVSPETSQKLEKIYSKKNAYFLSAPIFARPDGMKNKQAIIPISGKYEIYKKIKQILKTFSKSHTYVGEEIGSANVIKLCGNFLICSSIQAISEALSSSDEFGLERTTVIRFLSSSIFDCLIFKGYGDRIATFDHEPHTNAHFPLVLGEKDIKLFSSISNKSKNKYPFLDALLKNFKSALTKGNNHLDWSAISLENKKL